MQPRILYPARISFKIEAEINNFSKKQKLKEFSNTKQTHSKGNIERSSPNEKKKKKKKQEEIEWRKPQLESNHLNKPAYKSIKKKSNVGNEI